MRILIVTKVKDGGGTELHITKIAEKLRGRVDVDIAYLEDGFWKLYRTIRKGRFDVVHFFLPRPYLLGSIACEFARHRNRIMSRRSLTGCYQTRVIRFIERLLHQRTHILVGNSPAVVEQLRAEAPEADIRLIRNGVAAPTPQPSPATDELEEIERKAWKAPPSNLDEYAKPAEQNAFQKVDGLFQIICIANAFAYKGLDDLLAAIRLVGPQLPEPWNLWLVGRGTEKYNSWRVTGLGYRTDVATLLASSDLFILPSHEEGSSNALLEAMAAGVPVIATDVGGNKDAVIPGLTGMLVPIRSPVALGAAIVAMASNPNMRAKMANAAKADIARRFSWERCVDDYETLYHSALEGARAVHSKVSPSRSEFRSAHYRRW
jgi:glycosyltransferase involved in cell wall biosynthesis